MPPRAHKPLLRTLAGIVLLGLGGLALLPLGAQLRRAERGAGLLSAFPAITGDALAEQLMFFTLGGLRSLAAEVLTLDATNAWMMRDWPRAERRWQMITTLCPLRPNYWASAAQDMATNAAAHAYHDPQLSEAEQIRRARGYIARGERFLRDGLAQLPDNALLYMRLGDLYADLNRKPSFAQAAEAYHAAVERGASALYRRQEFYSLCRIRGREQEAWALGRELFNSAEQRVPSLRCLLFVLQNKLDVPEAERLSPAQLFGSEAKARRELANFERNQLRFPVQGIRAYLSAGNERAGAPRDTQPACGTW